MNDWFDERYIKKIPIEEQIRGQVRAECYYMDKADIYEWITQNEIKIINLQSKIDKISEYVDKIYDVMDYRDYPPYLDEIYYTLHPELKEEKTDEETVQS